MDVACHTNTPPDLNGPAAAAGPARPGARPMRRAIREHLKDFVAIVALVVFAALVLVRDPLEPAAALSVLGSVPRRRPVRARGRDLDRPGRDAGPGADREHGGGRDRRHPRGRPRRRPRDRDGGHQRAVRGADPHRRDRPDEAPYRPSGHDARGRPGHFGRPRGRGRPDPACLRPIRTSSPTSSSLRSTATRATT